MVSPSPKVEGAVSSLTPEAELYSRVGSVGFPGEGPRNLGRGQAQRGTVSPGQSPPHSRARRRRKVRGWR